MGGQTERAIREPHAPDPGRRGFLTGAGLAAMGAALGAAIPFGRFMPAGYVPVALARPWSSPASRRSWWCSATGRSSPRRRRICSTTT